MSPSSRVWALAATLVIILTAVIVIVFMHPTEQAPGSAPSGAARGSGPRGPSDQLLIPGTRVGEVWVGGIIDEVTPSLGKIEIAPRKDLIIYSSADLDLGVRGDRIEMVVVKSRKFKTKEGIAVGGSITPVIQAFGRHYEYTEKKTAPLQYTLDYWDRGVSFVVERDLIFQIKVFSAVGTPVRRGISE